MQTLFWQSSDTVPKNGTEFQAWLRFSDSAIGWWEARCRYADDGYLETFGRIDYDTDGWDMTVDDVVIDGWMAQPTKPEFDKENNDHE